MHISSKCDFCRCGEWNDAWQMGGGCGPLKVWGSPVWYAGVDHGYSTNTLSTTFKAGKMYASFVYSRAAYLAPTSSLTTSDTVTITLQSGGTEVVRAAIYDDIGGYYRATINNGYLNMNCPSGWYAGPTSDHIYSTYTPSTYPFLGSEDQRGGPLSIYYDSSVITNPDTYSGDADLRQEALDKWIPCTDGDTIQLTANFDCKMFLFEWDVQTRFYLRNTTSKVIKGFRFNARVYYDDATVASLGRSGNWGEVVQAEHFFDIPLEAGTNTCTEYLRPVENPTIPFGITTGYSNGFKTPTSLARPASGAHTDDVSSSVPDRRETVTPIFEDDTLGDEVLLTNSTQGLGIPSDPTKWGVQALFPPPDCTVLKF